MTKLEEIEEAVEKLSPEELRRFRAWLDELEERLFDERIERDAKAGKLDKLAAKAIAEDDAGTTSKL
jgi:mRNA-degrading endonuclease RelE of RelBE toxin-antitoxin system